MADGITDGIKEGAVDISSLSDTHPGDMYIQIGVVKTAGRIRMIITPSHIQNEVSFDFDYPYFIADPEEFWGLSYANQRCRIYELIIE